jgi:hypothetical protein
MAAGEQVAVHTPVELLFFFASNGVRSILVEKGSNRVRIRNDGDGFHHQRWKELYLKAESHSMLLILVEKDSNGVRTRKNGDNFHRQ